MMDSTAGGTLGAGESGAIAMSLEWPADLRIMDESSGRAGHCEIQRLRLARLPSPVRYFRYG